MKIDLPPVQPTTISLSRVLTDFDDLAGFFTGWQGRFEQISAGRFAGQLQLVQGRMIKLVAVEFNQIILARGYRETGHFSVYPVTSRNADGSWQGRSLSPGNIVLHGADAETNHLSARECQTMGITVRADVMHQAARVLLNGDTDVLPASWANVQPAPMHYRQFLAQFQKLLNLGQSYSDMIASNEWYQMEQECLRQMVNGFASASTSEMRQSLQGRISIVHSAEELMRSNLHQPLGVVDLCGRLGISDRTMRLAFL